MKAEIRKVASVWWCDACAFEGLHSFQTESGSPVKQGLQDQSSSCCDADAVLAS